MTPAQLKTFEKVLTKAANAWVRKGRRVKSANWDHCPIDLATASVPPEKGTSYLDKLRSVVGFKISGYDMWMFVYSFDNQKNIEKFLPLPYIGRLDENDPVYKLGRKFRKNYITDARKPRKEKP